MFNGLVEDMTNNFWRTQSEYKCKLVKVLNRKVYSKEHNSTIMIMLIPSFAKKSSKCKSGRNDKIIKGEYGNNINAN